MSINELNISIFDFIFNINMLKNISNYSDYTDALDTMIMEQTNSDTNYEFWQEYNHMISNSSLKDISTSSGYHYAYFPFPKMTMSCVNTYLDYKLAQSKKILEDNFNYDLENLGDDLNITNNFALKKIIDYLIDKGILTQNGEYAKMNILGDFEFDFENLKINSLKQKESPLFNQTIVNNNGTMAYSYNGNSIVNIQNQDDLFKIVLEKIEAMKAENIPEEKLEELIKNCKKKDSSKVISLLQTLAVEVSSSLIVKGILMMFGIPVNLLTIIERSVNMTDEQYIDIAIEISKNAKYPYGAIVVKDGEIIGRSDDKTLMETSMYSHAELEAIESASKNKNLYGDLKGATMYVSCEPCMMCMGAILYEEFDKLVYSATLQDSNDNYCPEMITSIDELAKYSKNKIEIVKELHRDKAIEVLKNHKDKIKNRILITGAVLESDESSKDIYRNLISIIDEYDSRNIPIEICSPLDTMKFTGNDFERYERAMNILKDTSIVIAEMSSISTGQGMELQEAVRLNLPILVIAKSGSKISGLIKGCKNIKDIIYYDEDIYSIKNEILKFVEGGN